MNRKLIFAAIGFLITVALGLHFYDAHENDTGEPGLVPIVDWEPSTGRPHEAVKPEGLDALDADDPVARAWAKLDELAENRFAWGGNTSPQTPGLIAQLTPTVEYFATEGDAEAIGDLLDELAYLRDSRSIETLIAYQFGGNILTGDVEQALIDMGPPVVPHLVPYLDKVYQGWPVDYPFEVSMAADILSPIGVQHRGDLDGIVEHIILPKLEERLASGSLSNLYPVKTVVEQAIAHLKR